jgi:hypothetical protein
MTLGEVAASPVPYPAAAAPDWLIGCFRRRSITFFQGQCDTSTEVYWLQARGVCADLRISPQRPRACDRVSLDDFTEPELTLLARAEGGAARTEWDGASMRWSGWHSFQLHDKWPEPGFLRRVGDCVIEFPPNGAYVEDWRLQPSSPGPVVGLQLIEERVSRTGAVTHQGGALIVCGDHAALVRGRPCPTHIQTRWADALRQIRPRSIVPDLFACEASYAVRDPASGDFVIALSTNPLREGQTLSVRDGFELDRHAYQVRQTLTENGELCERIFTIDTLERYHAFRRSSEVSAGTTAWLTSEAETLLAHAAGGDDC